MGLKAVVTYKDYDKIHQASSLSVKNNKSLVVCMSGGNALEMAMGKGFWQLR